MELSETFRVLYQINLRNSASRWLLLQKYITMHGPPNVKKIYEIINYGMVKVKVKVTLVQALRLCTGRKAHRGNRDVALLFHDQR